MLELLQLDILMITIGAIGIIVGSITDIQKREVADWINLSLVFSGVGIRALFWLHTGLWEHLVMGIVACMVMFAIGAIMYYSGQWGGGDAKMLAGIGALFGTYTPHFLTPEFGSIPFSLQFAEPTTLLFPLWFFVNTMIAGAIYGVIWSAVAAILQRKKVAAAWKTLPKTPAVVSIISYTIAGLALAGAIWFGFQKDVQLSILLAVLALMAVWYKHIKQAAKAIEVGTMHKTMHPTKLTEGEWILETLEVKEDLIIKKDTTIDDKQLKLIDSAQEEQILIKKNGTKTKINISELTEGTKIVQPCIVNGKKIDIDSFQGINYLMELKIREKSRYINIQRNEEKLLVHESKLKVNDVLLQDWFKSYIKIIDKNNLGIDRYQIELTRKFYDRPIQVKIGIPFIPAFLFGFLATLAWGSPLLLILF